MRSPPDSMPPLFSPRPSTRSSVITKSTAGAGGLVGSGVAVGGAVVATVSGVAVGGAGVSVGGTGVSVGSAGVSVGGAGVSVGGTGVAVGGAGVAAAVGGISVAVAVGGTEVAVLVGVAVGAGSPAGPQPVKTAKNMRSRHAANSGDRSLKEVMSYLA